MPSLLRQCLGLLRAPGIEVSFALRSRFAWSRRELRLPNEGKHDLSQFLPPAMREHFDAVATRLAREFSLRELAAHSTRVVYTANLALLDRLVDLTASTVVPSSDDGVVRAVDVGCGDFHYATALHRWLARQQDKQPRPVVLRGLEVDAFGIYQDGHSRADHARAHAALAETGGGEVSFEVADFTRVALPQQDVITLLFPFLSVWPCLRWGLPLSRWRPRRLVRRAVATVRSGGWLVVGNQTGAEFDRLCQLLADQPVDLVARTSFASDLVPWRTRTTDQVGSLWRRRERSAR